MMQKVFCSEDCRIVHKARDLHKVEYVTLDNRILQNAANNYVPVVDMTGNREEAEREEDMKGKFLSEEQKARAVEIALEGGDMIAYLRDCGCANPWGNWGYIKMKMEKSDPEKLKKIMEAQNKRKQQAVVERAKKLPPEARTKKPENVKPMNPEKKPPVPPPKDGGEWEKAEKPQITEAKIREAFGLPAELPEGTKKHLDELSAFAHGAVALTREEHREAHRVPKQDLKYKVIGIETKQGKFQYDAASDQMRWMPKGSTVVVMMPAEDWEKLAEDLPKIMETIGATDREADDE